MLRLGLCCIFREAPIKFRTVTGRNLTALTPCEQRRKLAEICRANANALLAAIEYCAAHGIGCFRINSQILPLKTHPEFGYDLNDLPDGLEIIERFKTACGRCRQLNVRLSMHPDQFVVLSSPHPQVVDNAIAELEYQAEFATWTSVDVINLHGGGAYGDKAAALNRFRDNFSRLSAAVRERLTVENDDRLYTPTDLLPLCEALKIPLVYDVHHHRCLPDGLTIEQATRLAVTTWGGREPLFHLSSPRQGWSSATPQYHHDYINPEDFPRAWRDLNITVEIEAKAKELAVEKLHREL